MVKVLIRAAREYFFLNRLANLSKLANQHFLNGTPKGDKVYSDIRDNARARAKKFESLYPDFITDTEVPVMKDLEDLTIPTPPKNLISVGLISICIAIGGSIGIGVIGGLIHFGYHMLVR